MAQSISDHGYTFIVALGKRLGSLPFYVQAQCDRAQRDNAPLNALHYDSLANKWVTTDDITSPKARVDYGLEPYAPNDARVLESYGAHTWGPDKDGGENITFPTIKDAYKWVEEYGLYSRVHLAGISCLHRWDAKMTMRLYPEGK